MEPRGRGRAQRGGRARGGDNQQSQRPGQGGGNGQYRGGPRGGQQGGQRGGQQQGGQRGGQQQGGQQQGAPRGGQQQGGGGSYRGGQGDGQGAWGRSQPGQQRGGQQQTQWGPPRSQGPPQQQSQWPQPQAQQQRAPAPQQGQAPAWGNKPALRWDQQQGQAPQQQAPAPAPQPAPQPQQVAPQTDVGPSKDFPKHGGRGVGDGDGNQDGNEASATTIIERGTTGTAERGGGNGAVRGRTVRSEILHTRPIEMKNSKQGSHGQPISLTANFFELIEHASWHLIMYEVKFAPEIDDTKLKKRLMYQAFKDEPSSRAYIFDGSSLYTPIKIHQDPLEKYVQDDAFGNVRITIKFTHVLSWGNWSYIQVFNLIIRKCLQLMQFELIQRNHYDANAMEDIPNHPLRVWPGYFTSIRQYEQKIMMNVDLCFKVMRKDNCYDLLLTCVDHSNRWNMAEYKRKLTGNIVLTYYNNKTYRIDDIDNSLNPLSTFIKKDGTAISYKQYYYERYKIQIQVNNQPLLVSKPAARERRAGAPELILLVPELCQLTGLTDEQRANFHLMSAMATKTRIPPGPRQQKLIQFARRLISNPEAINEIKKWDLKLADHLVKVQGRVLPNEVIQVTSTMRSQSSPKADWMNSCKSGMLDLAKFDQMIVFHPNSKDTQNFISAIVKAGSGMGWKMPRFTLESVGRGNVGDYLNAIDNVRLQKGVMTLVICVVPNKNAERYHAIKKRTCVDRGIPSQCVLEKQFRARGVMSIASKIAIQMNCKLGGTPWSVAVPVEDLMVVGYDVCRDTLNKGKSFGAMVASLNKTCSRYYSAVTEHVYSEEISKNFANFMCVACERWRQINGRLPARILIYRDGVGDGQIPYVFDNEVKNIKAKLREKLYPGPDQLKICVVIVTKRINTRLFHGDQNPPPGTIVDNTITQPQKFDFFLVPQCVNQGTVTPTSFNCIDFTNFGLNPDRLQILTYKMCHLYFNWSGTIRVPAPCQYAHKLAFLTAQSLHRPAHPCLDTLLFFL